MARYFERHERNLQYQRNYQAKNRETYRKASKRWREKNPEAMNVCKRRWLAENKGMNAANSSRYYTRKKQRAPKWLTVSDWDSIESFYTLANRFTEQTGVPHSVDHIVPLLGENVCGLHVPWNLQILTASENSRKSNRYD